MINFVSFYQAMNPEINLDFPVAKDENDYENQLIEGFNKVLRGFRVLNELSEWAILAGKSGRLIAERTVDANDELFDDFAHSLMDDLATVTSRFIDFKPDQNVDLMSLYTEVIDYLQLYFEAGRLWGDFEDRIGGALVHLSMSSTEIEHALYIAWILDINDPASERSNQFYEYVFEHLNKRLENKKGECKAIAERIYVGPLVVSIIATDEDVQFLVGGWEEDKVRGEWDDDYKFGQIYKNDKITPNSKDEWLDLMAPKEGQGFKLGNRYYETLEDAINGESAWITATGKFFL